jgi:hypothetical protein
VCYSAKCPTAADIEAAAKAAGGTDAQIVLQQFPDMSLSGLTKAATKVAANSAKAKTDRAKTIGASRGHEIHKVHGDHVQWGSV